MSQAENPYQSSTIDESPFASDGDAGNSETVRLLQQTRPWVMTVAVLLLLFGMVIIFTGIGTVGYSLVSNNGGMVASSMIGAALYLGLGVAVNIVPGVILLRYARRISSYVQSSTNESLNQAIDAQRQFWKCIVLVVLSAVGLYVIVVVAAISMFSLSSM